MACIPAGARMTDVAGVHEKKRSRGGKISVSNNIFVNFRAKSASAEEIQLRNSSYTCMNNN